MRSKLFQNIILALIALMAIPFVLMALIIFVPIEVTRSAKRRRRIRKWVTRNDYNYFLIYTTGKWKRNFFEQRIIPALSPGLKTGIYDGMDFKGFITSEVAGHFHLNDQQGFPIVGKIENGQLTVRSLKAEFSQYVGLEKNVERFEDALQEAIDNL